MDLNSLISEIVRATEDLETAPAGDLAALKRLLEKRSALIEKLRELASGAGAAQIAEEKLHQLRCALARGVFFTATLRMRRIEAAASLKESMHRKVVASSFASPRACRLIVDCSG